MASSEQILFVESESFAYLSKAVFVVLYFSRIAACALTKQARGRVVLMHASTP